MGKGKRGDIIAKEKMEADDNVVLPLYGVPAQSTTSSKALKFVDEIDALDYYHLPAKANLASGIDLQWSLLPKARGAQFELVFEHRIVGNTTFGDVTSVAESPADSDGVRDMRPQETHAGVLVRVPFLRKIHGVSVEGRGGV